MKKYSIIVTTNPYSASRNGIKNGKEVISNDMTIEEAQKELLNLLVQKTQNSFLKNWGIAVTTKSDEFEARKTFNDGTRSFTIDVFTYTIVPQEEE